MPGAAKRIRAKSMLEGKYVIVTGAAGGIGSLLAQTLFCEKGVDLILVDSDEPKLTRLHDQLRASRSAGTLCPVAVDITAADAADQIASAFASATAGRTIDGLINNAGVIYAGKFETMPLEAFERVVQINLLAAVRLAHHFLPQLISNEGFIVNVASGAGLVAPGGLAAYATSKFGLVGFSEALAAELGGRVRVSTICPAFVDTSIVDHGLRDQRVESADRQQSAADLQSLVHKIGVSPESVCRKIIRAMEGGQGTVPMTAMTHVIYNIKKIFPGMTHYLNHQVYRRLSDKGILR